ncbi:unnamed protein product [Rotaria sordida]|uniref:R3H domain-containing protein n=1 Tax=Rotaria sordida TaxID=392033 RepID=A0A813YXI8_9BILA|nr:unnamed protein product [Rotaria sordida]CAF0908652.1 unnamed protein product [Rotaria sordida]CAF1458448.1 unnamed protein product [Rotaria sordida]CAF3664687.1 unnamed protein product [Rotaria sordida]CAF3690267.1 unnamed protein product [Rotaria sordida]
MADIIDSCCVNIQMTKTDKNNNTTAPIDDGISLPSEQCDVLQNGTNDKSDNTDYTDNHRLSTNDDNTTNVVSSSTDENDKSINIELSNDTINPYKDFSGIDTESFITATLRNNPKDRTLLLSLEKVFQQFIQNEEQTIHQFQAMNSYERMIVHRVAAFYGLDHNVDKNGQSIIVTKTPNTRIPNFSFQNLIPNDESSNGAITTSNSSIENTTRRITRRNEKNPNQKTSFERTNHYNETRDRIANKLNRKQQRFHTNHHTQQTNIQPSTHIINTRTQQIYPATLNSYYPQQQQQQQLIDHHFKQQTPGSPMYNYVPMISPTTFQHGNSIPLPILLHQQPTGQIQYVFPTHSLQQPQPLSFDGQYLPVYRSDVIPPVVDNNNPYSQPPFVHLYPTHSYPQTQQTTFIQPAPSFMIPPNNSTSIQYATNQLATLSLQSQYDNSRFTQSNNIIKPFVQSSTNGLNRMPFYHQYRQNRPLNTNNADKQITPIENDMKSTMNNKSDQISLSESTHEKD